MTKLLAGATAAAVTVAGVAVGTAVWSPIASADPAQCAATSCAFVSPTRSISCLISFGSKQAPDSAVCSWSDENRAQLVKLMPNGSLQPCINPAVGLSDRCKTDPAAPTVPALGYGQTAALGPFTCLAEAQSISCTAEPSKRGFSINSTGILPVLPPPPPPPPTDAPTAPPPPPADASAVPPPPVAPAESAAPLRDQPTGQ